MNRSGIYKIINLLTNQVYVGSAANLRIRRTFHFRTLQLGIHKNPRLQNSYNKYGKKNFAFSVLEYCEKEYLIEREQHWIDELDSVISGFNCNPTAGSALGRKFPNRKPMTKEQREKIGNALRGRERKFSRNWREKLAIAARKKRPNQSIRMKLVWAERAVRITVNCSDCSKPRSFVPSAVPKTPNYRCRPCYLEARRERRHG